MQLVSKVKEGAGKVYDEVVLHWKKPMKGYSVPWKEAMNYALGGMGQHMVLYLINFMALTASNTLLGSTIGIRPMHLQAMAIIQSICNLFMSVVRGKLVDNTRTRFGRFRPYIAMMGFPLVGLSLVFLFLPFETMQYWEKLVWVFSFAITITMAQPLFAETYTELGSVMTANSNERARLMTVTILISSFAPTIYGAVVPMILDWTGLTFTMIETYRYIVAAVAILGVGLNLFTAFNCNERVISSKTYVQKVGLFEGMLAVYRNKYWWIRNIASIIGFLESGFSVVFGWMYIYGTQNMAQYALLNTLYGTASTIAMLITPMLLRKLGNRGVLLFHNTANIFFVGTMLLSYRIPLLFFACLYANTVFNQLQLVYNPVLNAEVKDYQQFLTGKRVDFILSAAGQITLPITLATGFVIPFVYEAMGITTNYDILYDPEVRNNMFNMLCGLSIAGAALNLIPFFFYRLSREKHTMIIGVLRRRAAFSDYANGAITPEQVVETVEGMRFLEEVRNAEAPDVKAAVQLVKAARGLPKNTEEEKSARKTAIKAAKAELTATRALKENKEAFEEIYLTEEHKFEQPLELMRLQIAVAMEKYAATEIAGVAFEELGVSRPTEAGKEGDKLRRAYDKECKKYSKMRAEIQKNYPDGVRDDYILQVELAEALPVGNKEEIKARDKALDIAERALMRYNRTFGYYNALLELLAESENREYYPEIESKYEEAVAEIAEQDRLDAIRNADEKERKRLELEETKRERFESFSPRKQARLTAKKEKQELKKADAAKNTAEEEENHD